MKIPGYLTTGEVAKELGVMTDFDCRNFFLGNQLLNTPNTTNLVKKEDLGLVRNRKNGRPATMNNDGDSI